jgi:acetyl-CoA carboxylase beta subunit
MSYEALIEQREPIDGWSVCTVCLSIDHTTNVIRRRWRCADCGVDSTNNTQRTIKDYLTENSQETIEKNLRDWTAVKGVRPAYKMLRSARYKCLLTLGRRLRGEAGPP